MGKNLLVIGASSDMGMAIILRLNKNYDSIIAHYHHMNENLQSLKEQLGDKLICLQADLSDELQTRKLIDEIKRTRVLPSHIIHFPAPICNNQRFHKISWNVFQNEMDISLKALILILQTFIPEMIKKHSGKIIIMLSSVVTNTAPAYCANYVVTKYAMLGLVKALATEYAGKGITVNGLSPSWVQTKYIANQPEMLVIKNAQASPIGRNLVVDDVIPTIEWLLSDGANCVNGQNIAITGG